MTTKFKLEITCENDAFVEDRGEEVARILKKVLEGLEWGSGSGRLRDINGNTVGKFHFVEEE